MSKMKGSRAQRQKERDEGIAELERKYFSERMLAANGQ
jgi:hypothetical protein